MLFSLNGIYNQKAQGWQETFTNKSQTSTILKVYCSCKTNFLIILTYWFSRGNCFSLIRTLKILMIIFQ